jgi:hypothetical protein
VAPGGYIAEPNPTFTWQTATNAQWYYLWVSGADGMVLEHWYDGYGICSEGI